MFGPFLEEFALLIDLFHEEMVVFLENYAVNVLNLLFFAHLEAIFLHFVDLNGQLLPQFVDCLELRFFQSGDGIFLD